MGKDTENQQIMFKLFGNDYFEDCSYMKVGVKYPFMYYEGNAEGEITLCPQNNPAVIFIEADKDKRFVIDSRLITKAGCLYGERIKFFGFQFDDTVCMKQGIAAEDILINPNKALTELFQTSAYKERQVYVYRYIRKCGCLNLAERIPYHILRDIKASHGKLKVYEIADKYEYSERHINRLFHSTFGCGPKTYGRIQRIYETVIRMCEASHEDINAYMEGFGYSDQAHFQREFKWYMGMTPKQFIKKTGKSNH